MSNLQPPIPFLPMLRRVCLAVIFACTLLSFYTINAQAAAITGRVTDSNGEPIARASVTLYTFVNTPPDEYWGGTGIYAVTNVNGEYTLAGFSAGTYRIGFSNSLVYREQFFDGADTVESANDIVITDDNAMLSGYDGVLALNGRIYGQVIDPDSNPLSGVGVSLWRASEDGFHFVDSVTTFSDGMFNLIVPTDDPHTLWFNSPNLKYESEYYNSKRVITDTDTIILLPNEVVTLTIDLSRIASIKGSVTDSSGEVVVSNVTLYRMEPDNSWTVVEKSASAPVYGVYDFQGLPPGKYRLGYEGSRIIAEYYNNQSKFEQATILDLTNSSEDIIANGTVTRRGVITGTVTVLDGQPLSNMEVLLYYQENGNWLIQESVLTDWEGKYRFRTPLPDVEYRVQFTGNTYAHFFDYASEYFENASTLETSQVIKVPVETTIANINAHLDSSGVITGTVTDSNGKPLSNVTVQSYDLSTGYKFDSTSTGTLGNYQLALEPNIEFGIEFAHDTAKTEFYNDQPSLGASTVVTAPINSVVPNINAQLDTTPTMNGLFLPRLGH